MKKPKILLMLVILIFAVFSLEMTVCAEEVAREETLIIDIDAGRLAEPTIVWNPYVTGNRRDAGAHILLWEAFFYINPATGEYIPWLATGYEYLENFSGIVVHLRRGVTWSDGVPFTADDVVFTYNMLLENAPLLSYSSDVNKTVKSVEKIDDYTVKIEFKFPYPKFHLDQAVFPVCRLWGGILVMPKHVWEGKKPLDFTFYPPMGTGPYRFVEATETTVIYERRDDWWGTEVFGVRPGPKRVIYSAPGTIETKAMLMSRHEFDGPFRTLPGVLLEVKRTTPTALSWSDNPPYGFPGACPRHLALNYLIYPWNIPEVRKAVSYLINREFIAEVSVENGTFPCWGPFSAWKGPFPYEEVIKDLIERYEPNVYNPQKAQEIFESLGFTKGSDGIWVTPNGTRLELTILSIDWSPEFPPTAESLMHMLREGGIDATVKLMPGVTPMNLAAEGRFDAYLTWTCLGDAAFDPEPTLRPWHSMYWMPIGNMTQNIVRYRNPEYDEIINEMQKTPVESERYMELYKRIMEIYFRDVITIPVIHAIDGLYIYDSYYWINWITEENPYAPPWPHCMTAILWIVGYPSPKTGEWVGGLRPRNIGYTTVYFVKGISMKFRGIDLKWYGPFSIGDAATIPVDDAEFWVRKGYASYTPPAPHIEIPEIAEIMRAIQNLNSTMTVKIESVSTQIQALSGQIFTITIVAALEGIIIILLAILLVTTRRK
jgi:peptide/nickel transport system substrate-binding protein